MAEYAFLAFYKDHPQDRQYANDYDRLQKRQRGASMGSTTLSPVLENVAEGVNDTNKSSKRRFSLDFIFSKKRKFKVQDIKGKRGSTDSTASTSSQHNIDSSEARRTSVSNFKLNNRSEATAWCFA
ncbi:hypothetical protein Ocin01_00761 [Orchesella cincta]|uniref:Uncharacterized protein n=1 Tax=Orchesella cincta TaxID=48709 RepID=A0A1D2NLB7_ORCCI|nr:hypothetical protein Ocin01_00761 [Orchesella cincta]